MKIILLKNLAGLGKKNDIKDVPAGYAKNFLIPNKLAEIATISKQKNISQLKLEEEKEKEKEIEEKKKNAESIRNISLNFELKGDEERGFGSISKKDIAEKLKEKGIELEEKYIVLEKNLKTAGDYSVKIDFGSGIEEDLKIKIKII